VARPAVSPAAVVLALAVPFIFLHPHYQASVTVGPLSANFSDFAILAAVVAAFVSGVRHGFGPLRGVRTVWIPLIAFCLLIFASLLWAHHADPAYGLKDHFISALKFVEYVFLAAAVPLAHGPSAEEIAGAVVYLAGARSITGVTLAVDGGQHLAWQTPDTGVAE